MANNLIVDSVRDLGMQFVNNPHKMVGQDGAYSIPLNGETLWFFGDTLIGRRTPGESLWFPGNRPVGPRDMSGIGLIEKMINNTGLLLPEQNAANGLQKFNYILNDKGSLKNLIPLIEGEDPNKDRIWCLHGVALSGKVYLYFIKVQMLESGELPVNFKIVGSGLAVGNAVDWEFKRVMCNNSFIWWGKNDPRFASAVLKDPENVWLYCYGVRKDENSVQNCYLARVRPEQIENFESYEYLISSEAQWSKEKSKAIPIFSGVPNELSVSFNKYLNAYLAVHSLDLSGKIVGRTAPNPWGPWSEPYTLWVVEKKREKELPYPQLIYAGKEHPELSKENGKILYLTYVEFEEYFPHLIEVTLK